MSHHLSFRAIDATMRMRAHLVREITCNFLKQASLRLYGIRQPVTSLCTTSIFLVYNLQLPHTYNLKFQMYNLQLPCVQPPTSSYNLKFQMYNLQFTWVQPPTSSYNLKFQMNCITSNFLIITMIILVVIVMVMVLAAMWSRDTLKRLLNPRQN